MRENPLKSVVRELFFKPGSVRTICIGPMKGMRYRVGCVTGMSPWYSGSERGHQRWFQKVVRPGNMVMDLGANWGLHTLYLSRLVGTNGLVVAVEPYAQALSELNWHLEANGCSNVKVLPLAVSNCEKEEIFVPGDAPSTGQLVGPQADASSCGNAVSVPVRRLDSLVEELNLQRLDMIKIDVEGAEERVFLGAQNTIERFRPRFVVELHGPQMRSAITNILTKHDYIISPLTGKVCSGVEQGAIVATPRSIAGTT